MSAAVQCVCCGRVGRDLAHVSRGRIHLDCYTDHHCGPDTPWPPDHRCRVDEATP